MGRWLLGIGMAVAGLAVFCNLPNSWWMPVEKATLNYLASTTLESVDGSRSFKVSNFPVFYPS